LFVQAPLPIIECQAVLRLGGRTKKAFGGMTPKKSGRAHWNNMRKDEKRPSFRCGLTVLGGFDFEVEKAKKVGKKLCAGKKYLLAGCIKGRNRFGGKILSLAVRVGAWGGGRKPHYPRRRGGGAVIGSKVGGKKIRRVCLRKQQPNQ